MSRADRSRPRAITHLCRIAAAVAVAVFVGACSVDEAMPAPTCSGDTSALLAAQSVPTASEIPCLEPLPDGWLVASVSINQDRTVAKLDSDRAGTDAAVLRLEKECDVAEAVTLGGAKVTSRPRRGAPSRMVQRVLLHHREAAAAKAASDAAKAAKESKPTLDIQAKLKEVLCTNLCLSGDDVDKLF